MACEATVAEPLGHTEAEQQAAERDARQSDDEGEPAGVGAGSGGRKTAEQSEQKKAGEDAGNKDGRAPLQELASSVVALRWVRICGVRGHDRSYG